MKHFVGSQWHQVNPKYRNFQVLHENTKYRLRATLDTSDDILKQSNGKGFR